MTGTRRMTTRQRLSVATCAALLCLAAAGCDAGTPASRDTAATSGDAGGSGAASFIGRQAEKAIAKASHELETGNIRLGDGMHININGRRYGSDGASDGLPTAEITPEGDLLIDGEAVSTTPEQRALVLEHRRHVIGLARAGMTLGIQGADIAGTALTGIGQAMFGGDEGRKAYEARVEAHAEQMKAEAVKLCALLPGLYDSQQALAAALPAFAPYATMERSDIDDCGREFDDTIDTGPADAVHA